MSSVSHWLGTVPRMVCPWLEKLGSLWKVLTAGSQILSFLPHEFFLKGGSYDAFHPSQYNPSYLSHLLLHLWAGRLIIELSLWMLQILHMSESLILECLTSYLTLKFWAYYTYSGKWTWTCTFILFSTGTLRQHERVKKKITACSHL